MTFKIGDAVVVKAGVEDPDLGADLGGWQGRISELEDDQVCIDWDSITLRAMDASMITQCEQEGLDWSQMYLSTLEIDLAKPRDTKKDVENAIDEIGDQFAWVGLGEEGVRIQKVLSGIDPEDTVSALKAWKQYLDAKLKFPIKAEVVEVMIAGSLSEGNKVVINGIQEFIDELTGIFAIVSYEGESSLFPLADLEVLDRNSDNYQLIKDYVIWYANQ